MKVETFYLEKLLRRLGIDEGNDTGAGGLNEFDIGGGDVGGAGGVAEAAGGAVAGMADDSDDWLVVEVGVRGGAALR